MYVKNDFLLVKLNGDTQRQTVSETSVCNFRITNHQYTITLFILLSNYPTRKSDLLRTKLHSVINKRHHFWGWVGVDMNVFFDFLCDYCLKLLSYQAEFSEISKMQ